jgi:hypothetical protein
LVPFEEPAGWLKIAAMRLPPIVLVSVFADTYTALNTCYFSRAYKLISGSNDVYDLERNFGISPNMVGGVAT